MDDIAGFYHPPPPGLHPYHQHHHHPPPVVVAAAPPPSHVALVPHDPYQFHHQQHPPSASYAHRLASPPPPSQDEVRTLFVAGLPEDVKPREIYNLFREFPGYESSNLRTAGKRDSQPFAFAVFSDQHSAVAAMHAINGMVFDLEKGSTLYIDLAKSNSKSKRSRIADDDGLGSHKKFKGPAFPRPSYDSAGVGSFHIPGMSISAHNTIGYPTALRVHSETGAAKLKNNSATVTRNNPPCPTLFVANLGTHCDELELTQVFSRYPGFIKLKIQGTYGDPIAFVDYQDTAGSTEALNQLQGAVLYSSSSEGLRIEYAKSRMGRRKKSK